VSVPFDRGKTTDDVVIARVVKPHGIRGEIVCSIESDLPDRFDSLEDVTLSLSDGSRLRLAIEDRWSHSGRLVLKLAGYDSRTSAESLVGGCIVVAQSDALPLENDAFYAYDLVGCAVFASEGRMLGSVQSILFTGGTDCLVVGSEGGRQYLIPFADEICDEVDLEGKRIRIKPPEGLLEI
jgi:16S rRNA processing protein RimM